jgi:hypothetical protein
VAVTIAVANLTVPPMNVEFYSISLSGWTRVLDSIALTVGAPRNAFRTFPTPGPLIAMRDYVNWLFCHFVFLLGKLSPI